MSVQNAARSSDWKIGNGRTRALQTSDAASPVRRRSAIARAVARKGLAQRRRRGGGEVVSAEQLSEHHLAREDGAAEPLAGEPSAAQRQVRPGIASERLRERHAAAPVRDLACPRTARAPSRAARARAPPSSSRPPPPRGRRPRRAQRRVLLELLNRARPVLLEEPRERSVGQDLPARLAARAVVDLVLRAHDPLHARAAHRARLPVPAVHRHPLAEGGDALGEAARRLAPEPIRPLRAAPRASPRGAARSPRRTRREVSFTGESRARCRISSE